MKWIRPSGTEFESNDLKVTIKYLESLGWKKASEDDDAPKEGTKPWLVMKLKAAEVSFDESAKKADLEAIYNDLPEDKK